MDAIYFHDPSAQFLFPNIHRELIKAYVSFLPLPNTRERSPSSVATGHWGCGAFNGNRQLKGTDDMYAMTSTHIRYHFCLAIIQLLAASEARRSLIYTVWKDQHFGTSLTVVHNYLIEQNATVGDLYRYLKKYSQEQSSRPLFDMILNTSVKRIRQ
jgi:poly(ADP-ribose) glycohydrolase